MVKCSITRLHRGEKKMKQHAAALQNKGIEVHRRTLTVNTKNGGSVYNFFFFFLFAILLTRKKPVQLSFILLKEK